MTVTRWEYQVVEEPNPLALQERLTRVGRDGWEAASLGCAGDCRLLALVRRPLWAQEGQQSSRDPVETASPTQVSSK